MPRATNHIMVAIAIAAPHALSGSDCCAPTGTPGCDDVMCTSLVCVLDALCCSVEWDQACADLASEVCTTCGGAGTFIGACCFPNGGCAQASPIECDASTGAVFVGFGTLCANFVCPPPCTADINDDGTTDSQDLNLLLTDFGNAVPPGTGADLDDNGVIDSADLNILLSDFACER
jgi:hypothetical protein